MQKSMRDVRISTVTKGIILPLNEAVNICAVFIFNNVTTCCVPFLFSPQIHIKMDHPFNLLLYRPCAPHYPYLRIHTYQDPVRVVSADGEIGAIHVN